MRTLGWAFLAILTLACDKTSNDTDNTVLKGLNVTAKTISLSESNVSTDVEQSNNILDCFYNDQDLGFDEAVIKDLASYQGLANLIKDNGTCEADSLPSIDFSKYTLIGKYVTGGGCSFELEREVYDDAETKTITYHIVAESKGECALFGFSWNWMLIPSISDDYLVQFKIDRKG